MPSARAWMGRSSRIALLLALLAVRALEPSPAHAGELRAGLGVAALPAPPGGPLGGYGGLLDRRAEGKLDPPEARALVLEQAEQRVGLVSIDVVIAHASLREDLRAAAAPLGVQLLLLVATHTHSGPGGYLQGWLAERVTAGRFDPAAREGIAQAAALALSRAVDDLAPAVASSAEVELAQARNRRFPGGPHETSLPVLRLDFADGRAPAVIFAYGAHPTLLSPRSRDYSADYVGTARAALAARGWRALFLPGPLGDQAPTAEEWPSEVAAQRAQTHAVGARVAEAVAAALALARSGSRAAEPLSAVERWSEAPAVRVRRFCALWWLAPLARSSLDGFLSSRVPFAAISVGGASLAAVPAEPTAELGAAIRSEIGGGRTRFAIAHAGDWIGYAVTPEAWQAGTYEACLSLYGPDFGPWLVEQVRQTLRLLDSRRALPRASEERGAR